MRRAPVSRTRLTWAGLLAAAQAGDLLTTWTGLQLGVPEGNPLVRAAMAAGTFDLFAAIKVALVAALLGLVWLSGRRLRGHFHTASWRAVKGLAVVFTAIAAANAAGMAVRLF